MAKQGRPTIYTEELADKICDALGSHTLGLNALCDKFSEFPHPDTVRSWRHKYDYFSAKYLQAMQSRAMLYEEETFEIAAQKITYCDDKGIERFDAGAVAWQKMNVNLRQWHASKMLPKVFGAHKQVEETNPADTLNKIRDLVTDLNKTNVSDI